MTDPAGLDPDAAAHLGRLGPPRAGRLSPGGVRADHDAHAPLLSGPGEPVVDVQDHWLGGVPVRALIPPDAYGTTVYVHGGGWVAGSLDTYEPLCRSLALRSGSTVLSVGYDLAPELRHPGQVRQVLAVLGALLAAPDTAQAGDGPVALAGDSAGAHLATLAATRTTLPLAGLALVYPVVAPALDTGSARDNASGYGLTTEDMHWFWQQYLPADLPADLSQPGGSQPDLPVDLVLADLAALPPTLVLTAGRDPLRDEGRALADAVERAGVRVQRVSYEGQIHGFFRMTAVIGQAREAHREVAGFLRAVLSAAEPGQGAADDGSP